MSDDTTILKHKIDPDQPDAHQFEDKEEIFFQDEFEEALISICEHIDRLDTVTKSNLENLDEPLPDDEEKLLHRHSTIGIFGQRGVGKTSFLLTIKDAFDRSSNSEDGLLDSFNLDLDLKQSKSPEDLREEVWTLDSIDPSLIENEDKLLVTITSKILDHVRKKNDGDLSKNRAIQDALEDLSRRFRVLFSDATDEILKETASDPLRFAGEVLFDADSGPKLAKAFHRFLALAAEDLGVRCFLLPIDDVDTSFDKGWPLLETLRKYLATDRLITVVSGDLEFFDLIVEQEAHKRTEDYRKAKKHYYKIGLFDEVDTSMKHAAIQRFPGQYLQKLFSAQSQLQLPSIHSVLFDSDVVSRDVNLVTESKKENSPDLMLGRSILVMSRLLYGTTYLPNQDTPLNPFGTDGESLSPRELSEVLDSGSVDALIPLNTRHFISLLEVVYDVLRDLFDRNIQSRTAARKLRRHIATIHSSQIRQSGLSRESLHRVARGDALYSVGQAFLDAQIGSMDLARLQTNLVKDHILYDRWRVLLSLIASALYADWTHVLTGPIRYSTKVKGALSTAETGGFELDDLGIGLDEPSWKTRCRLLRSEMVSVWKSATDRPDYLNGVLRIPRERRNRYMSAFVDISPGSNQMPDYLRWWRVVDQRRGDEDTFNTRSDAVLPDRVFRRGAELHAQAVQGIFRSDFQRGGISYRYIDFHRGLARIDDFIRKNIQENKQPKVEPLIRESTDFVLQLRGQSTESAGSVPYDEEAEAFGSDTDEKRSDRFDAFRNAVEEWCVLSKNLSNQINIPNTKLSPVPSPRVLIQAHDQFVNNCDDISGLPWRQQTVGTMLERYTMAFWNALLQKEVRFRIEQGQIPKEILPRIDFGFVRDRRKSIVKSKVRNEELSWSSANIPQNAFTRNINRLVLAYKEDQSFSLPLVDVLPYTIFWVSCPFLLSITSKEMHNRKLVGDHTKLASTPDIDAADGLLRAVYCSIVEDSANPEEGIAGAYKRYIENFSDPNNGSGDRPKWQKALFSFSDDKKYKFDIHDILCGIARADTPRDDPSEKDKNIASRLGL